MNTNTITTAEIYADLMNNDILSFKERNGLHVELEKCAYWQELVDEQLKKLHDKKAAAAVEILADAWRTVFSSRKAPFCVVTAKLVSLVVLYRYYTRNSNSPTLRNIWKGKSDIYNTDKEVTQEDVVNAAIKIALIGGEAELSVLVNIVTCIRMLLTQLHTDCSEYLLAEQQAEKSRVRNTVEQILASCDNKATRAY